MNVLLSGAYQNDIIDKLIQMSASGQGTIITLNEHRSKYIESKAKTMELDIPKPIGWWKFIHLGEARKGPYLLEKLDFIFTDLGIGTITIENECTIENLPIHSVHYGDELAAKIREDTEAFSKLSDFDHFVLNNGYRYKTREELYAGYDRHWKAAHDILVTMDEFLAEAGKKKEDIASNTYEVLVGLAKKGKLHIGDILDYAHFHWCLDKPEAVIAYQTGRGEWSVNNCATEITDEAARLKICDEWGFETGRTHIIGTPYYDATDYQFIRFNCAHMAWLWRNGNLLPVYC